MANTPNMASPTCAVRVFNSQHLAEPPASARPDTATEERSLVVCHSTKDFRHWARRCHVDDACEAIIDVGCSTGLTSAILAKRFPAKSIVGVDISADSIAKARARVRNHVEFIIVDSVHCKESVLDLIRTRRAALVFVDIGGNRDLSAVVVLLAFLLRGVAGRLAIVAKSEALYAAAVATQQQSRALDDVWLSELVSTASQALQAKRRAPQRQRYPVRMDPADGVTPLCRFFNYFPDSCRLAEACPHSHAACHFCLRPGHRAADCAVYLADLPVGSFRGRPSPVDKV